MTIPRTTLNSPEHRSHISRRVLLKGSAAAAMAMGAAALPSGNSKGSDQPVPDTSSAPLRLGKVRLEKGRGI